MNQQKKQRRKLFTSRNLALGVVLYLAFMAGLVFMLSMRATQIHMEQQARIPSIEIALRDVAEAEEAPAIQEEPEETAETAAPEEDIAEEQPKPVSETPAAEEAQDKTESESPAPEETIVKAEPEKQEKAEEEPVVTVNDKALEKVVPPEYPETKRPSVSPQAISLPPAPIAGLIEETPQGQKLPRRALDGREPWKSYARPFDQDDPRPRINIIVSDMGLSANTTRQAIEALPGEVTLSFVPYAKNLGEWMAKARAAGHETLLSIPMEPMTYPKDDPGPNALLSTLDRQENVSRLHWALARTSGYLGIMNFMGSRFTSQTEYMSPIIEELKRRGLLVVDSSTTPDSVIPSLSRINGVPYARNDRFIDNIVSGQAIDKQLSLLESIARKNGHAVGIAFPYPVTFERLNKWIATLDDKNIVLAPLSALASKEIE